jgi:hypothetical protein
MLFFKITLKWNGRLWNFDAALWGLRGGVFEPVAIIEIN